jgi:hypothetical protein
MASAPLVVGAWREVGEGGSLEERVKGDENPWTTLRMHIRCVWSTKGEEHEEEGRVVVPVAVAACVCGTSGGPQKVVYDASDEITRTASQKHPEDDDRAGRRQCDLVSEIPKES